MSDSSPLRLASADGWRHRLAETWGHSKIFEANFGDISDVVGQLDWMK